MQLAAVSTPGQEMMEVNLHRFGADGLVVSQYKERKCLACAQGGNYEERRRTPQVVENTVVYIGS